MDTITPRIERIDPRTASEDLLREMNAFGNRCRAESRPEDPPTPDEQVIAGVRAMPPFVHPSHFLIRDEAGRIIASGSANYEVAEDNQHLLWAGINVAPEHRRKGYATALLARIVEVADEASRTMLMGGTGDAIPAGAAFAERIGATKGYRDHTNRLQLADVDRALIDRWIADAATRSAGYSLIAHDGPYGDDLIERVIPVHELMNTAPKEDLAMEDWKITREKMEAWEHQFFAVGNDRWSLFAQHDATGELVGFTEIAIDRSTPETFHQMGTAVHPEHRGAALGKWLKAAMLRRILDERPDIVDVRTANADSNAAMLAINTELGFKPFRAHASWQVEVETVRAYLAR